MSKLHCLIVAGLMLVSSMIGVFLSSAQASHHIAAELEPVSACRFIGRFTQQKFLSGLSEPVDANGQFLFDCERGVIWQVQQPESDVLVLRNALPSAGKNRAYRLLDNQVEKLKGRQSKFLTQLIMSLMAGDQGALQAQFDIEPADDGELVLSPKKRGLKRAIKHIQVATSNSQSRPTMNISIVDRNAQTTVINASQGPALDTISISMCEQAELPALACELLLQVDELEPNQLPAEKNK